MRALVKAATVLMVLLAAWLSRRPARPESPIGAALIRSIIKHPWLTTGVLGVMGAAAALLVIISGIVPIKASSGHWAITAALLDFAKVRSVATHSFGVQSPSLDDPALVLRGASHYESGCYPCHGGPGGGVPPVMAAMTPVPPELSGRIARWTAEELFSIVKHGIKFTGMPAWPAQERDDEVWAVVAFLRRMPRLDVTEYRRLAYGEPVSSPIAGPSLATSVHEPPPAVLNICSRCHGPYGTGRGPGAFPALAGQRRAYLYSSLRAFADRTRFSGIMSTIAANLDDQTMRDAANYYEGLAPRSADGSTDVFSLARGEGIAHRGIPASDVPSCADCHGPTENPRNPAYPVLAGQHARYLALQLELFKARRRGGSGYVNLMHVFVDRLGSAEIKDVTLYYEKLARAR
jgi:cytochrome c553/cytochrome c5